MPDDTTVRAIGLAAAGRLYGLKALPASLPSCCVTLSPPAGLRSLLRSCSPGPQRGAARGSTATAAPAAAASPPAAPRLPPRSSPTTADHRAPCAATGGPGHPPHRRCRQGSRRPRESRRQRDCRRRQGSRQRHRHPNQTARSQASERAAGAAGWLAPAAAALQRGCRLPAAVLPVAPPGVLLPPALPVAHSHAAQRPPTPPAGRCQKLQAARHPPPLRPELAAAAPWRDGSGRCGRRSGHAARGQAAARGRRRRRHRRRLGPPVRLPQRQRLPPRPPPTAAVVRAAVGARAATTAPPLAAAETPPGAQLRDTETMAGNQYCNIVYGQCNGRVLCRETACTCPVVLIPRCSTLAMAAAAWIAQGCWDRSRSRTCSMCAAGTVHAGGRICIRLVTRAFQDRA